MCEHDLSIGAVDAVRGNAPICHQFTRDAEPAKPRRRTCGPMVRRCGRPHTHMGPLSDLHREEGPTLLAEDRGSDPPTSPFCRAILIAAGLALLIRVILYLGLWRAGYFFGIPWDTFSRTYLSYQWSQHAYFAVVDGYWVPLQFWVVGLAYRLVRPLIDGSSVLVPASVNNIFFAGSLLMTCLIARRIGGRAAAVVAALLIAFHNQDVWVTFSGLSEPILIFFVICSTYLFVRQVDPEARRPVWSVAIGVVALLAAATHYIGWFLALFYFGFLGVEARRAIVERRYADIAAHLGGMLLCGAFPALWLAWNAANWGDPLHFTGVAKELQAGYVGRLTLSARVMTIPQVFATQFPVYALAGIVSAAWVPFQKRGAAFVLLPGAFLLLSLWGSTAFAFTAPYQEPRYLLLFVWILTPFTATAAVSGLRSREVVMRGLSAALVGGMAISGLWMTFRFENSFSSNVREVGRIAGDWLEAHPPDSRVVIESDSFAERGVIPVVSGHPDRFTFVDDAQIAELGSDPFADTRLAAENRLTIVKDRDLAVQAASNELSVLRAGEYFIISLDAIVDD